MKVAYVLYPDFTALDLVGPYEVISRWPDAEVHFVARSLDPVRCDRGLTVIPTDTPKTLPDPDLIVVPGSGNPVPVLSDEVLLEWLRAAAPGCQWTASVCTGAGLYAVAGLLEGKATTTHWGFRDNLRALGVEVVGDRVVWQGNHVSGAGVSAGIDMALSLTERVHGRQLAVRTSGHRPDWSTNDFTPGGPRCLQADSQGEPHEHDSRSLPDRGRRPSPRTGVRVGRAVRR